MRHSVKSVLNLMLERKSRRFHIGDFFIDIVPLLSWFVV